MKKVSAFVLLWFSSVLGMAQRIEEPIRSLAATYYPNPLEQASESLIANNIVTATQQVKYRAGKSVLLTPGFEAKAGAVFVADTKYYRASLVQERSEKLLVMNFPNPFVEKTTIVYQLANDGYTNLYVSNSDGKIVGLLVNNQFQEAGRHEVEWRADQLPAGSYLCTLEANRQRISSRIVRK